MEPDSKAKGRRWQEVEQFLDKANIERGLETLSDLAIRLRGKPSGRPNNPGIVWLKNFALLYLAHGLILFLYETQNALPELYIYAQFRQAMEVLVLWPVFYAQFSSWVVGVFFLSGYFAVSYYPGKLSCPAYGWQERMDKLEHKLKAELAAAQTEAASNAKNWKAAHAKAEEATLAVEGQLRAAQGMLADERQRGEAAERELRSQLEDAAQRERLLLFQRDAGDRGPAYRAYDTGPEATPRGHREEPSDPIEEIYGS